MQSCLFCRNTIIFNIHKEYGRNSHTAKDDMIQFFGYQIEGFLKSDDAVCHICMKLIYNLAKIKRRLLPLIFRTESPEQRKPLNLSQIWGVFATNNQEDDSDSCSPTPSLLTCKSVVPYEDQYEMKLQEIEQRKAFSQMSYARSDVDSEIVQVFANGKRKKRRKRGKKWVRRKVSKYSRASSYNGSSVYNGYSSRAFSTYSSRAVSAISDDSYSSFYPLNGELPKSVHQDTETMSTQPELDQIQLYISDEQHECSESGCTFTADDIDALAKHKRESHEQMSLYFCKSCNNTYTTREDLNVHQTLFHPNEFLCVICHREFGFDSDLSEHWQYHYKRAVPCKYCNKRYLNSRICSNHQKFYHMTESIINRIDYDKSVSENCNTDSTSKYVEYQMIILDCETES